MSDTTVTGNENVVAWINNASASSISAEFRVKKQTGLVTIFRIEESGDVVPYGPISRDRAVEFDNVRPGSGNVVSFHLDYTERAAIGYTEAANTVYVSATSSKLNVKSSRDIVFRLDHDHDGAGTFRARGAGGYDFFTLTEKGTLRMLGSSGSVNLELSSGTLTVGGGGSRGEVLIRRDSTSGSNRAGVLILEDKDGAPHYFFVDSSNRLRVAAAAPAAGAADVTGLVVGA